MRENWPRQTLGTEIILTATNYATRHYGLGGAHGAFVLSSPDWDVASVLPFSVIEQKIHYSLNV